MPIAFATEDNYGFGGVTRGSQITTDALKAESFVVNARYYTAASQYGRDFFDGQQIKWDADASRWTYSPVKYWPTTGEIDFYAYSPTSEKMNGTFESLNMPHNEAYVWLMHYNVASPVITSITELSGSTITADSFNKAIDADNQQDLLLAVNTNQQCSEERGINSKVQFNFKHALAGLKFQLASTAGIPTDASHVIISIAPMCTGGTIAMDANGSIIWTTDQAEATYYQAYKLDKDGTSPVLRAPGAEATPVPLFFLPPQNLKNFTVTARFYKQDESGATYTLLATRSSNRTNLELKQGVTQTLNIK